ncbi:MAG: transcriptional regulator [Candidatus Cloacimonadaceae bacterium]
MPDANFQKELKQIAALDQVIHTPARLITIMLLQQAGTLDFIKLMSLTELTWGNLSTHLSKLEGAGYVMITKTFKGKRPHTLISLTESGRQAYQQWGQTIIKALPGSVMRKYLQRTDEFRPAEQQPAAFGNATDMPEVATRDVFFLPRYHRWGMELPPIREFNPLS